MSKREIGEKAHIYFTLNLSFGSNKNLFLKLLIYCETMAPPGGQSGEMKAKRGKRRQNYNDDVGG